MYQNSLALHGGAMVIRSASAEIFVNDSGVVVDGFERLACPQVRHKWRGSPPAEIKLCQTRRGWAFAVSYYFPNIGDGEPLSPNGWGRDLEPTREAAIASALGLLAHKIEIAMRLTKPSPESRSALAWIESLRSVA